MDLMETSKSKCVGKKMDFKSPTFDHFGEKMLILVENVNVLIVNCVWFDCWCVV